MGLSQNNCNLLEREALYLSNLPIKLVLELTLRYRLETHLHANHIAGAGKPRHVTGYRIMLPHNLAVQSRSLSG